MSMILLNGPSSAGKSSIARILADELAAAEGRKYRIISLDDYLSTMAQEPIW